MAAQEVLSGSLEMWLPSEFLGDDFFLEEKMYRRAQAAMEASAVIFSPDSDSPPDSATETEESDEEEFVAGLTTQMARSSLGFGPSPVPATTARRKASPSLACSPQSPLCSAWPDSKGPPSQVPSHPEDVWERLCLRNADEVEQQKLSSGFLFAPRRVSPPCPVPQKSASAVGGGYYYGHENPHQSFQLQQQLKQQQHLKQQQLLRQQLSAAWSRQNRIRAAAAGLSHMTHGRVEGGHPPLGPARSTWPSLQQPPPHSAGMRAVFLTSGSGGARKQSSGTGVFLPRRVGSPTEPRKKPACSTVLVPAKVVQALNLNLDDMGLPPHLNSNNSRITNGFFCDRELLLNARSGATLQQKRISVARPPPNHLAVNPEARLPPEWTY